MTLMPKYPLYSHPFKRKWKIFVEFWGCNLKCGDCKKAFAQENIIYYTYQELIDKILSLKSMYVVFTGWEPCLYEPIITDLLNWIDKANEYRDFFKRQREIVTNWSKTVWWYYDKVVIRYKLHWWKIYDIKAIDDRYDYIFTIQELDDLFKLEELIFKHNLKKVILQTKNKDIKLKDYCKCKGLSYRDYVDIW